MKLTMGNSFVSVIGQVATVALTVMATRWIFGAKGPDLPRIHDGTSVYGIKWQWPAVGFAGAAFAIVMAILSWHDLHSPDWTFIMMSAVFMLVGIWLGSGAVTTDQNGVRRKSFWGCRSFRWSDITELRVHTKQGGAIELRSGPKKLVIDFRVVAFQHLLDEIKERTKLQPSKE